MSIAGAVAALDVAFMKNGSTDHYSFAGFAAAGRQGKTIRSMDKTFLPTNETL